MTTDDTPEPDDPTAQWANWLTEHPLVPYSVERSDDDDWIRNKVVLRMEKIGAFIPVSREVLRDANNEGPRHDIVDPDGRWSGAWREMQASTLSPGASGGFWWFWSPPPYESTDRPVLPTFRPFPRLDALGARIRPKLSEARRRARNALDALKGSDPYDRDDYYD